MQNDGSPPQVLHQHGLYNFGADVQRIVHFFL